MPVEGNEVGNKITHTLNAVRRSAGRLRSNVDCSKKKGVIASMKHINNLINLKIGIMPTIAKQAKEKTC